MKEIIILDIETTGFEPSKDKMLELGIVKLDLNTGKCTGLYNSTFKYDLTEQEKKAWIFENGFMCLDDFKNAKELAGELPKIQKILNPYRGKITAWNRDFDAKFLEYHGLNLGGLCKCPMKESTAFFGLKNHRGYAKWPKAQEAHDILFPNEPYTEKHRGFDDAVFESRIILELYHKGIYQI